MSGRLLDLRGMAPPEPMMRIMSELPSLGADDWLDAVLPHEPVPLYGMLDGQGYSHEVVSLEPGRCVLRIKRAA